MSIQVVVFKLDKEDYAIPILEVREVIKVPQITPVPNSPAYIAGLINLRGKVVPIIDIEKLFNLQRVDMFVPENIIIIEDKENSLSGVFVDKLDQVLKIEESEIKPPPKLIEGKISAEYLRGVLILENNRILLILDLEKILPKLGLDQIEKISKNNSNESINS